MNELKPCPFCNVELFSGQNVRHKDVMRHPYHMSCPLSEAQWIDSPGFRERWNRRAQPANALLTLDELRGMDGEPVWCEDTTNYSGIIKLAEDWSTDKPEAHIWTFEEEGNPKCYNVRLMMEFGAKFYLRKPEGGNPDA
ncbi:MAG: hypothetical protein AAGU32_14080 [Bacillota bacterium]